MKKFLDFVFCSLLPSLVVLFLILTLPLHIWWTWKGWDIEYMIWYSTLTDNQRVAWKRLKNWRYLREEKVE